VAEATSGRASVLRGKLNWTSGKLWCQSKKRTGPVADFCTGLRLLQESRGLDRSALARRLDYSRSQLYAILDGHISRPPEWDRLVEPLVRACTGNDERAVAVWRQRYAVLLEVDNALRNQHRQDDTLTTRPQVMPAQLPADVNVFTGRAQELADLDRLLARTVKQSGAAGRKSTETVMCAITGTAGVGKTALTLRWAHRVRGKFPDGQLYVNLRGYSPDQPVSAGDALAGFLRVLGLPGPDIPLEVDERAATYRSLLNGRRMLVVLDNAVTVEQVRPLLPGTASCLVVVTSRDSLAGLVARHGAQRLDLGLLPSQDAVALLRALIGERIDAEPDAAITLAGQCARLPLALRVAAELATARPAASLAELVSDLGDEQRRLKLLNAGGDPRTAVRTVFSWSYQHLPADAARTFRRLGLHPGPDLDPHATTALTDTSHDQAHDLLDLLACAHLVQSASLSRYGMHDLLRAYAADLAKIRDGEYECYAARTNLFDYYLSTATAAVDALHRVRGDRQSSVRLVHAPTPSMSDPATALAWLDDERPNLVAICAYTATYGWPGHTIRLAATLSRYLDRAGFFPDALVIHSHARHAACHISDRAGEAHALTSLGMVHARQGRYGQAIEHFQQAIALFREVDDRGGEARALDNLGLVHWRQGRYGQAPEHHRQALTLFRETGRHNSEANALGNLGAVYGRQGHYEQAAEHLQQAIAIHREVGDRIGEAYALDQLGVVYGRQGCYEEAAAHQRRALTLFRETCHRDGEPEALNSVGETLYATGQADQARAQHAAALTLAIEASDRYEQARAHTGLANLGHSPRSE
jgi:tetratricopeptide (TPR) repeat protein